MINTQSITIGKLPALLRFCHEHRLTAMIHGEPGVGKSSAVIQYAAEWCEGRLENLRLTQLESVDLRGMAIPDIANKKTTWLRPEFLPEFLPGQGEKSVLFLDELDRAEPRLQASALQLLLERQVGKHILSDEVLLVCAGNGSEWSDQVYDLDPAVADRMVHFHVRPDVDSFCAYGVKTGRIHPDVMAFLRVRPDYLSMNHVRRTHGRLIAPTPRGWERVSDVLRYHQDHKEIDRDILISGIIGREAAAEFFLVLDELESQVRVDELFSSTKQERMKLFPDNVPGLYRMSYALLGLVKDAESAIRILEIINELNEHAAKHPNLPITEIRVLSAEMLFARVVDLKIEAEIVNHYQYDAYIASRGE